MKIHSCLTFLFVFAVFSLRISGQTPGSDSTFSYISTFPRAWENIELLERWPGLVPILKAMDAKGNFSSTDRRTVWVEGDVLYGYNDCGLDIFKAEGDQRIDNLYFYDNKGYNCTTRFFKRDGRFYLLGGYGYWQFHVDLMEFDESKGAWELVHTQNQPKDYLSRQLLMTPGGVVAIVGGYFNSRYDFSMPEDHGFFLDWTTKTWSPIRIELEGDYGRVLREKKVSESWFETAHFGLFFSAGEPKENGIFIFDKQTLEVFFYPEGHRDLIPTTLHIVEGDVITYLDQPGNFRRLDVAQMSASARKVGRIVLAPDQQKNSGYGYAFGGIFLLSLVAFFRRQLKKRKADEVVTEMGVTGELDEIIRTLEGYPGAVLTGDELNLILHLGADKSVESSRVERARLIKKINAKYSEQRGKQLIHRIRNTDDKRIIDYRITP